MSKKKIMVVDDEDDFLKIIKINLEHIGGYEVLTLRNAKNILSELHNFKPDLVLLDLLMPGVGGMGACEMLNKDPLGKETPIIILSALDKDQDKLKAYKKGVTDYITKPIEIEELIAKIEKALNAK